MSKTKSPVFTLQFCEEDFHYDYPHFAQSLSAYPRCQFVTGKSYPFYLPPQTIRVAQILHCGENSTVYLGHAQDGTELALKFTPDPRDLRREAAGYDALEFLQGTVVPKLYGVLYGRDCNGDRVLCLVLERFGDSVEQEFRTMKTVEK